MTEIAFTKENGVWKHEMMLTEATIIHVERKEQGWFNIAERIPGAGKYVATREAQDINWGQDINTGLVSEKYPMQVMLVSRTEVINACKL